MRRFALTVLFVLGILVFVPSVVCAGYPPRNGTVAYWNFDEGSGTIATDISGNGNDGIIYGANWTSGKVGKALSFDGVDDYVDIGNNQSYSFIEGEFTIEAWIKTTSNHRDNEIVAKGASCADGGYKLITCEGFLRGSFNNKDANPYYQIISTQKINDGKWHHVAFVVKGLKTSNTYAYLYIDGEKAEIKLGAITYLSTGKMIEVGEGPFDTRGWNISTNSRLGIGYSKGAICPHFFNGLIDEVRILNRALSEEEIIEDYKSTKVLFLTTDKTNYSLGDTVKLTIGLNYSKDMPPVYASFKLELIEPVGTPDVLIKTPIFSLTPGFTITKTLRYKIPSTIWIPDGEYEFQGTLCDSLGNIIERDSVKFFISDAKKSSPLVIFEK